MEENKTDTESKKGGTPSQIATYQRVAAREKDILDALFEMLDSGNENIRLGAAKTLLNKILPDKKAVEVTGENGQAIIVKFIDGGFMPPSTAYGASTASTVGPGAVQSPHLAPEGAQDNHINTGNRSTGPS